jgi:proline iminopeptidase
MRTALVIAILVASIATQPHSGSAGAPDSEPRGTPHETRIPVGTADLYAREIGRGQPIIVLHGGPDFDHSYLLPDMDRLSDVYRLIYYDQRGRGRSADRVQPDDVSLASDIADLDKVREYFHLDSAAVLGHSWGALLALEYAIRHPERVSHLILMNPAPVSTADFTQFRKERLEKLGGDLDRLRAVQASDAYREGNPDAVAAYYRILYKPGLQRPEDLRKLIESLRASFTKEGTLKARAIEVRLVNDTWMSNGYDLRPKLERLKIPTLVIYSDHDLVPAAAAAHIARAIPNARMVTLKACGHFSYLECPAPVRNEIDDLFRGTRAPARPR